MTAPETREALKPCPFCGGEAELRGFQAPEFWVSCPKTGCKASTEGFGSKDKAITAWNTRATTAREQRMREALEGFVASLRGRNTLEKMLTINHAELVDLISNARSALSDAGGE